MTVYRLNKWEEFKALVSKFRPKTIFYIPQPHPLKTPPLGLRLTFYNNQDMYVFVDHAEGASLSKTGIPVASHMDKVHAEVREEDIRNFLSKNFPQVELVSLPPFMY